MPDVRGGGDTILHDPFLSFARSGIRPGLSRIRRLLAELGHPEADLKVILVAGSNGKGTVAASLEAMLGGLVQRTGLFTSPHLRSVRERFRVNGRALSVQRLQRFVYQHEALARRLNVSYFELTTACALWMFRQLRVEWSILEIGLGGRWDACNVTSPELAVITSIAREHTEYLGSRLGMIGVEKAQVARPGKPVLVGPVPAAAEASMRREFERIGAHSHWLGSEFEMDEVHLTERKSSVRLTDELGRLRLATPLRGHYAAVNVALAAAACRRLWIGGHLDVSRSTLTGAVRRGARNVRWPGRLQVMERRPLCVADVAHNAAAFRALARDWQVLWPSHRPVVVVGLLGDKNATAIGKSLAQITGHVVLTRPESERALDPEHLARLWRRRFDRVDVLPDMGCALAAARREAGRHGAVLACGSHFLVGPILRQSGISVV